MSTFTTNKNIEKPAHGSYANAWDVPANADFDLIDSALAGTVGITVTGASGTVALLVAQYTPPNIQFTGTLTRSDLRASTGVGWVRTLYNNTSGAHTLQFGISGGGAIVLAQGSAPLWLSILVATSRSFIPIRSQLPKLSPLLRRILHSPMPRLCDGRRCGRHFGHRSIRNRSGQCRSDECREFHERLLRTSSIASANWNSNREWRGVWSDLWYFHTDMDWFYVAPTGAINWKKNGKQVTLTALAAVTGTSNSNVMTLSGLPAACTPSSGNPIVLSIIEDNSTNQRTARALF